MAPDDTTFEYLAGREFAPKGARLGRALAQWKQLRSDEGASYDQHASHRCFTLEPMITFGTNPGMGIPLTGRVPDPATAMRQIAASSNARWNTWRLQPGQRCSAILSMSCLSEAAPTRGCRISDAAASVMKGGKVGNGVRMLVVPGSQSVKRQAEAEGLDQIFKDAGAQWREAGCSMCIAMNGDQLEPGRICRQHQQPELRRPSGQRQPNISRIAADGGRFSYCRAHCGCPGTRRLRNESDHRGPFVC